MIILKMKSIVNYYIGHYIIRNIRKFYNTIYYYLGSSEDFLIVNCSFKQWGRKVVPFNIGDDINAVLFQELSGKKVLNIDEFFHNRMVNIMGIGSIIEWKSTNESIVWGSGIMDSNVCFPRERRPLKVVAVRGRLTKQLLVNNGISCPDVFGDPALLLPYLYKPVIEQNDIIGIIPHYVDLRDPILIELLNINKRIRLIDIQHYKDWKEIINQICSFRYILSSSLHGLILSDAYGIPNLWVKFSEKIVGDGFKYLDYFSAVERVCNCIDLREEYSVMTFENSIKDYKPIVFSKEKLLKSCPFKVCDFYQ